MIEPYLSDQVLLADTSLLRHVDGLCIWWLGQSGFMLFYQNTFGLLDPYLSDSLTKKYAGTDKPHVRMSRRVINPRWLDFMSFVTSSHNHTDHLDGETLCPLIEVNGKIRVIVPEANREFAADRLGVDPSSLLCVTVGGSVAAGPFEFIGVPAAHETIERDAAGRCKYLGYIIRAGPWTVYHSGDTVLYEGMVELLRPYKINFCLLPINGRAPERRVAGNLNGREAAWLAKQIGARVVIPCHYDMFEFNTADPQDEFVPECERLRQPYRVLRLGERFKSWELPVLS